LLVESAYAPISNSNDETATGDSLGIISIIVLFILVEGLN